MPLGFERTMVREIKNKRKVNEWKQIRDLFCEYLELTISLLDLFIDFRASGYEHTELQNDCRLS